MTTSRTDEVMRLPERIRSVADTLRRKPMPLADIIPLLQEAADAIQSLAATEQGEATRWEWQGKTGKWFDAEGAEGAAEYRAAGYKTRRVFTHPAPVQAATKLWLWKNGPHEYWAFDNAFPVHLDSDDPQTLGEPCGYALVKPSRPGRPEVDEAEVMRGVRSTWKGTHE